jgi:hypothetical protein
LAEPSPASPPGVKPCTCTGSVPPIGWVAGSVAGVSWPVGVGVVEAGGGVSVKVPVPPPVVAGSASVVGELGVVTVAVPVLDAA